MNEQFRVAAQRGDCAKVKRLLAAGAQPNARGADGWVALVEAAYWGHVRVVRLLIKAETNLDNPGSEGKTALMAAAYFGYDQIVTQLIKAGAKLDVQVNVQFKGRWSALMMAAWNGHTSVVKQLLDAGADPDLKDENGQSAKDLAMQCGNQSVMLLLQAQASRTSGH